MTKISIIAVGRCRDKPIGQLIERYRARLKFNVAIQELPASQKQEAARAHSEDIQRLADAASGMACRIALDERGKDLTSEALAAWLQARIEDAQTPIAFLIGGADGLPTSIRDGSDLVLSFGRLTWPHMLVRAMLMEQLYRAETIIRGHPYHRS